MNTVSEISVASMRDRMLHLEHTSSWEHSYHQDPAMKLAIQRQLILIAQDKRGSAHAAKEYYTASLKSFWNVMKRQKCHLRNYYEWITERFPCHFYIDFEYYPGFNPDSKYSFEFRRQLVLQLTIEQIGKVCDASHIRVFETDASKSSKHSRHYVIHVDGHMFRNQFHCGALQRQVQLEAFKKYGPITENPFCGWTFSREENGGDDDNHDDKDRTKTNDLMTPLPVMDHGVYTKHRILRVPWATKYKPGEYRPLIPIARWVATRRSIPNADGYWWDNAAGQDECERLECKDKLNPDMDYEMLKEGMVQCMTESFFSTCKDGVIKIIETTEPGGGTPSSNQNLLIVQRRKNRRQRGVGGIEMPNLIDMGAIQGKRQSSTDNESALRKKHGDASKIDRAHAQRIRDAMPIVMNKKTNAQSTTSRDHQAFHDDSAMDEEQPTRNENGDEQEESLEFNMEATHLLSNRSLTDLSSQLCVDIGDQMCKERASLDIVTTEEWVDYYWNFASSMVFAYQLRSKCCSVCNRVHTSNNIKMVVLLEPSGDRADSEHPSAPVVYYKCYKNSNTRTVPRALPFYVKDEQWKQRIDDFKKQYNSMYMQDPRELVMPLLEI